jgi:hypothetical protein
VERISGYRVLGFLSLDFYLTLLMASIICGSLAFDTIMNFEGRFAEQILPDQLHILNVSFLVPGVASGFWRLCRQHCLQPETAGR